MGVRCVLQNQGAAGVDAQPARLFVFDGVMRFAES